MFNPPSAFLRCFILLPLPLLAACQELETLRDRTAVQEVEIARLRKENQEFQNTYYQVNQERAAEVAALREKNEDLQRQIERARQNLTEREHKLEEDMKLNDQLGAKARQDLEARLAQSTQSAAQLNQTLTQTSQKAAQIDAERTALAQERDTLKGLATQTQEERDRLKAKAEETEKELTAAKAAHTAMGEKQKAAEEALAKEKAAREAAEKAAEKAGRERKSVDHRRDDDLIKAAESIRNALAPVEGAKAVEVDLAARGLRIILPGDAVFEKSSVLLTDSFKAPLAAVAAAVKAGAPGRMVRIEGHTDNQPTVDMPFADNWGLGAARADTVRRFLTSEGGLADAQLEVVSRGDREPRSSNDTPEGRARNRRVELVITSPVSN